MRALLFSIVFCDILSANAIEPIPQTWKNNPQFGIVYRTTREIPMRMFHGPIRTGEKVMISRRYFSNQLDTLEKDRHFGILLVGGEYQEDSGGVDGYIPISMLSDYLQATEEKGPPARWERHLEMSSDEEIPNIKPTHYLQNTFPVNTRLAEASPKERPTLVASGWVIRMIRPSPFCSEDEVTVRLSSDARKEAFLKTVKQKNPEFAIAGPWYGTDYCVSYWDLIHNFHALATEVEPNATDALSWEEVAEAYHSKFVLKTMQSAVVEVSPYSNADSKEGRFAPPIRVIAIKDLEPGLRKDLPLDGWIVEYSGPLYYACSGAVCRAQGYRIVLDSEGKVLFFQKNNLYSWNHQLELPLDRDDEKRLLDLCNDPKLLAELYQSAKQKTGEAYAAQMSSLSAASRLHRLAGNTYGTFVIHVSKVRERLGLRGKWPIYDGKAPRTSDGGKALP